MEQRLLKAHRGDPYCVAAVAKQKVKEHELSRCYAFVRLEKAELVEWHPTKVTWNPKSKFGKSPMKLAYAPQWAIELEHALGRAQYEDDDVIGFVKSARDPEERSRIWAMLRLAGQ